MIGKLVLFVHPAPKIASKLPRKRGSFGIYVNYVKADVDNGGTPNAADATLVLKHIVELNTLKDE